MKKTIMLILLLLGTTQLHAAWVNGYTRRDGTYVQGHYRSDPDNSPYNNQSYPGSYNQNTGRVTSGNQQEYLQNYYTPKPSYNRNNSNIYSPYNQRENRNSLYYDNE